MAASMGDGGGEAGGPFIDSSRLDLRRYARRPSLAMVLADYLVFVERNPRKVHTSNCLLYCATRLELHSHFIGQL